MSCTQSGDQSIALSNSVTDLVPMRYQVIKDLPGYLRVRYGRNTFSDEQGYGMAEELRRISGVTDVSTTPANGGVLIRYSEQDANCLQEIKQTLATFDRACLPVARPDDAQLRRELDSDLTTKLIKKVGFHYLCRFLLPLPLRHGLTILRSAKHIGSGLKHLLVKNELTVEVLDATAISAALLQGMYDSASSIILLLGISELLEDYTRARSRVSLEQSLALNIEEVWLVTDSVETPIKLSDIREGDRIRVRSGSMVPIDGEILEGEAEINEASITGESRLASKSKGASVFAGTVIDSGSIVVRARQVGSETRINNIVRMVEESEKCKAGAQSRAERLADGIVPFSFLAFFGVLAITRNMTKAMSVLMVDYSCAIKLSTPVAVMSALSEAASQGTVVKGGRYLETIAEADTIVFDKTGTLTTAVPTVEAVVSFGDLSKEEVLRVSACLEEHFPHSVARAIVSEAKAREVLHADENHADVKYVVAHGIASEVDGKNVLLGSSHYIFDDEGVVPPAGYQEAIDRVAPGASVVFLAIDSVLEGAICVTDPVRDEAAETIAALRKAGFEHVVMLTGDSEFAAKAAADKLGITEYRYQVLPEDKARIVEEYQQAGHSVVMVGDGVNDSPALACADCSIAMVDASDIAREVADVTLLNSSLDQILELRELGNALMARIVRNYHFIVTFNTALLVGGVAGILQPAMNALLHNTSTMLITASNMRPLLDDPERSSNMNS